MFLSAVWSLILTAPIHCRASIAEQVMEWNISPNLIWCRNKLLYILDSVGELLLVWVNYSFKTRSRRSCLCVFQFGNVSGSCYIAQTISTTRISLAFAEHAVVSDEEFLLFSRSLSLPHCFLVSWPVVSWVLCGFWELAVRQSVMARAIASRQILLHMLVKAAVFFPNVTGTVHPYIFLSSFIHHYTSLVNSFLALK